jgi:curved DNA-binding protein CbpA
MSAVAPKAAPKKGCPYQLLGVERTATASELRKSYHKLARACHPDKNRELGAVESFQVRWRD